MIAFAAPLQVVFSGALTGLTYGTAAVALILVYRSSRVINLATAEMGGLAAAILGFLVVNHHVNYWLALVLCVAIGAATGAVIELVVVRRLVNVPRVMLLVATIGVAQLLLFGQAVLPQPTSIRPYPTVFASSWKIGGVFVGSQDVLVIIAMPLLIGALAWFLVRTRSGLAIRASAAHPPAARLAAISVRGTSTLVWAIAGAFSALATILAAPFTTTTSSEVFTLGPGLLVRVLAAALIGRMVSLPWALAGGVVIGTVEAVIFYNNPANRGLTDLLVFGIVLLVLLALSRTRRRDQAGEWSFAPRVRTAPITGNGHWWTRRSPLVLAVVAVAAGLLPLVLAHTASAQFQWSRVVLYAMAALSLTVLTGWAGQLSIGQFAFVGLGAMTAATMIRSNIGPGPALVAAALVGGVAAVLVGTPALRLPGLFLAVSTLALGVASSSWLLSRSIFLHGQASSTLPRLIIGGVNLTSQRTYYAVCLAFLLAAMWCISRLRQSGVGRSFIAVRSNEAAAASFGLSPTATKLTAFAISGGLAGLSGGLLAGLLVTFSPDRFSGTESLSLVSIGVIGGLASVSGTVLGAIWVIGIPALAPNSGSLPLLTSGVGLLVLVLFFPGGLAEVVVRVRNAVTGRIDGRAVADLGAGAGEQARPNPTTPIAAIRLADLPLSVVARSEGLTVRGLTVARGPRIVVFDVDLAVETGEVVGLIGANGAGKSTIMDAVGGFLPYGGTVALNGTDLEQWSPARRARHGLGRTYQGAHLFADLTMRETVQVALGQKHRATPVGAMLGLPGARRAERQTRAEADDLMDAFGLGPMAHRFVDELSTGTRRMLELACVVVRGSQVLCLDEPTAGIAQRESEALAPFLLRLRDELGATLLVIEHDMPFITSICDRLYCLHEGRVIADGPPDVVRADPAVVAVYLGTDAVAINRSGTPAPGS